MVLNYVPVVHVVWSAIWVWPRVVSMHMHDTLTGPPPKRPEAQGTDKTSLTVPTRAGLCVPPEVGPQSVFTLESHVPALEQRPEEFVMTMRED